MSKENKKNTQVEAKTDSLSNEVLVAFHKDVSLEQVDTVFKKYGLVRKGPKIGNSPLYLGIIDSKKDTKKVMDSVTKDPEVRYCEKNIIMRTFKTNIAE